MKGSVALNEIWFPYFSMFCKNLRLGKKIFFWVEGFFFIVGFLGIEADIEFLGQLILILINSNISRLI